MTGAPAFAAPADGRPAEQATPEPPELVLDLSRLLSRVLHTTPTGVDRVEMAYAQELLRLAPDRLSFAATHPSGLHGRLPRAAAIDFLELTREHWEQTGQDAPRINRWARAAAACLALAPRPTVRPARDRPRAYLHLSARSLERRPMFEAILRREQARLICFVHDLIPLTHPEYARPKGPPLYRRKIETVVALADAVLVNSQATAEALQPYLEASGRPIPTHVATLAPAPPFPPDQVVPLATRPYFVVLGTIEPRKNHLLLLNIWRRFVETRGPKAAPRLVLIGRRGWENENILDLLDRCPALHGVVEERSRLPDHEVRRLVAGACALLMPSFAEGFGLPVIEALALGAPVIASDMPALREAGGDAPDYLDPLDGLAWSRTILDYAAPGSRLRHAQLRRLHQWAPPRWDRQVGGVLDFITEVCR